MNANSMRRPTIPHIALSASAIVKDISGNALPPYETVYWFDKLIDHTNPELGTFKQRYWHTWEYYKPGSWNSRPFEWIFVNSLSWTGGPIILTTPGESNAESNLISDVSNIHLTGYITGSTSFLTNQTMSGKIAEQQNGATIVLEHRFFGLSNPYPDLSVKSLQVLTIQQAIDDLVYFAETVKLEMPGGDQVSPEKAPWVLVGGSYSGLAIQLNTISFPPLTDPSNRCPHNLDDVQVSATRIESMCPILMKTESTVQQTGIFWAGYSSSGVVQPITYNFTSPLLSNTNYVGLFSDFWGYFEPIRQNMPKNCSPDVQLVIAHIDQVLESGDQTQITNLMASFGLGNLTHPYR